MANLSLLNEAALRDVDLTQPDNVNAVWPAPRDAKVDTLAILRAALDGLGLQDVVVSKDGAFTAAALQNEKGAAVPYVTVTRTGDQGSIAGIGRLLGVWDAGDPALIDQGVLGEGDLERPSVPENGEPVVPADGAAAFWGEFSDATIDVTISDKVADRADQLYIVLKHVMIAALAEFRRVGYVNVRRVNGTDSAQVEVNGTSPFVVFNRTLTYALRYPEMVVSLERAVNLVKQTLDANPASSDTRITTDL